MNKNISECYLKFLGDMCQKNNPQYSLTLTLGKPYSDRASIEAFSFFMKLLQKQVKTDLPRRGIAFLERTWKNARYEGQLHMHAILWGMASYNFDADALHSKASESLLKLRDSKGLPMTSATNLDIQPIFNVEGLVGYDTKDLFRWSPKRQPRIYEVTKKGLDLSCQLNFASD
jgi:hypothetical protein